MKTEKIQNNKSKSQTEQLKKEVFALILLGLITLVLILLLTDTNHLYGSDIDWVNQHSVFPEYFRQQFYHTGNILPEFAPHIGGGQNIFHFSYYGFLSPLILPSYLFPQVPMTTYLMIISISVILSSLGLFYVWIRQHNVSFPVAVVSSFLFQFSASFLYHSHKQIMFINYMPFLILALFGVDRYFKKKKSTLLIFSIFLMIMTSYFYSVGGLLMLTVYGIYSYFNQEASWNLKQFLKAGMSYALRLFIPIGMAAILLLPSLAAIKNGRSEQAVDKNLGLLLLPNLSLQNLLYDPYGIGLTAIHILALLRLIFSKKKPEKILFCLLACIFGIPLFLYLLNGGLYLRGKVFLPFLPLLILITAFLLEDVKSGNIWEIKSRFFRKKQLPFILFGLCILLFLLDGSLIGLAFLADSAIVLFFFVLGKKKKSFVISCLPSCILCFIICVIANFSDSFVTKPLNEEIYSKDKLELLTMISKQDDSLYRINDFTNTKESCNVIAAPNSYRTSIYSSTYDANYNNFHGEVMSNGNSATNNIACRDSSNLFFQTFMGVKYLISDQDAPANYQLVAQKGIYKLYKNDAVFPIAYASSSLMGEEEFNRLASIDRSIALLWHIVVKKAKNSGFVSPIKEETFSLPFDSTQSNTAYQINSDKEVSYTFPLEMPLNKRLLLFQFYFKETPDKDIVIQANQITNRLTSKKALYPNNNFNFHYVISENKPIQELKLTFSSGTYELFYPKLYSMDCSNVTQAVQEITPLITSELHTFGTILKGTITTLEDGYFTASIPYDKGFKAYVDGKEETIETVNTAFLGFPLKAGTHRIELVYHAPLLKEGKLISLFSCYLFLALFLFEFILCHCYSQKKKYVSLYKL